MIKEDNSDYKHHIAIIISLFIIILLILVFGFIIVNLPIIMDHNTKTIETSCYDEYKNKIDGLVCYKKIKCNYKLNLLDDKECNRLMLSVENKK